MISFYNSGSYHVIWLTVTVSHQIADTLFEHCTANQTLDMIDMMDMTIKMPTRMFEDLDELKPSDVTFLQILRQCKNSVVFKVAIRGEKCVMKVVSRYVDCSLTPTPY